MKDPLVTLAPLFGACDNAPHEAEQYCGRLNSSPSVLAALVEAHGIEHEEDLKDLVDGGAGRPLDNARYSGACARVRSLRLAIMRVPAV